MCKETEEIKEWSPIKMKTIQYKTGTPDNEPQLSKQNIYQLEIKEQDSNLKWKDFVNLSKAQA